MARKPTPKVVSEVCSLCGLDWQLHGENPTTETCIGLLLDEVRSLNARLRHRPYSQPVVPFIPVYPRPYPVYPRPHWQWSKSGGTNWIEAGNRPLASSATPRALKAG